MQFAGQGLALAGAAGKAPVHKVWPQVPVGALQLPVTKQVALTDPTKLAAHAALHVPLNTVRSQLWGQGLALLGDTGKAAPPHVTAVAAARQYVTHCEELKFEGDRLHMH